MVKRKELKDNDVEMSGTNPRVDGDDSDEVHPYKPIPPPTAYTNPAKQKQQLDMNIDKVLKSGHGHGQRRLRMV